jgi:hypothetical protein
MIDKTGTLDAGNQILAVACIFILHVNQCQKEVCREYCIGCTPSKMYLFQTVDTYQCHLKGRKSEKSYEQNGYKLDRDESRRYL